MNFKPQIKTLSNGLRLITLNLPQSPSVTALLMVKVGSRYEKEKLAGISHFLEHMVFKGTKKYPTSFDLTSTVDAIGAEFNAFTTKEYTGFYVKSAVQHLDLALDVLSQLVFQPLLPEKEMQKEKGVIIEEINMYEDNPMVKVGIDFEILLYPDSRLGCPTIGYKKSVKAMKRSNFLNYLGQYYRPKNMILGIVGGMKKVQSANLPAGKAGCKVQNFNLNKGPTIVDRLFELQPVKFIQQKPALQFKYKKTNQTHFCLGVRALPHGHKDRYVMAVLSTILGGNMSSRLFMEVREKRGLAYYIRSSINTYFDHGYFMTQAGTDVNKAGEAIKVILNELRNTHYSLRSSELKRAKEYLKGKLALSLEDSQEIASLLVEDFLLEDKIRTPKEIIEGIEKVSLSDIKRVARQIFVNQGLNLAIIGPYKDETRFAKILKI